MGFIAPIINRFPFAAEAAVKPWVVASARDRTGSFWPEALFKAIQGCNEVARMTSRAAEDLDFG
jgi:hypothetical protein